MCVCEVGGGVRGLIRAVGDTEPDTGACAFSGGGGLGGWVGRVADRGRGGLGMSVAGAGLTWGCGIDVGYGMRAGGITPI